MRKILASLTLAASLAVPTTLVVAAPAQAATSTPRLTVHDNQSNFNRKTNGAFVIQVTARHDSGARMAGRAYLYINGDKTRALTLNQGRIRFKVSRAWLPNNKTSKITVRIDPRNGDIANRNTARNIIDRVPKKSSSGSASKVVRIAKKQVGDRYVFGAAGPSSFDCSGFTRYAWKHGANKNLPHSSAAQGNVGKRVSKPRPGDLVVTKGHVALYAGNGKVIEAATPATGVIERKMWQSNPEFRRP